jgi:hypothetical protein
MVALERKALIAAALLLAATVAAAPAAAMEDWFVQTLPLAAGGSFALQNVNGPVLIESWDQESVEIRALKTTKGEPADLDQVRVEVSVGAGRVEVRTRYPEGEAVEVLVAYHVRVPRRVRLDPVETINGNIVVRGVEGSGVLRTVNGGVEMFDGAGSFSARTMNGDVRLELREFSGPEPAALETVNGSVVLVLPADAGADLEVTSVNGDFRSDLPLLSLSSANPAVFRARLGSGGCRLRLVTVNGGIRVVTARPIV